MAQAAVERRGTAAFELTPTAVYSIAEVQVLLNVSRKTVVRLIEEKRLPASRVGRQYRVPGACLLEFLARSSSDPERTEEALLRYIPTPAALLLSLRQAVGAAVPEAQAARAARAAVTRVRSRRRK